RYTRSTRDWSSDVCSSDLEYVPIRPVQGRLPSQVTGLHLEAHERELRLYNPATGQWLPTPMELITRTQAALQQAEAAVQRLQQEVGRASCRERLEVVWVVR